MASQSQLNYIRDLAGKKDLSGLRVDQQLWLTQNLENEEVWLATTSKITFAKARIMLDKLIPAKDKPRAEQEPYLNLGSLAKLPPGRYAIENVDGELRFYQVWESRDKRARRLYVQHSDETSRLPMPAQQAIAQKILDAGVRECAIRYGMEIGSCSNCGRTLTNELSRRLGIGPVCGGRMFGDDGWRDEVKTMRQTIIDEGGDPGE
jgi:phosphoglycolate phosphatase-like HAD superfamily hydrolase